MRPMTSNEKNIVKCANKGPSTERFDKQVASRTRQCLVLIIKPFTLSLHVIFAFPWAKSRSPWTVGLCFLHQGLNRSRKKEFHYGCESIPNFKEHQVHGSRRHHFCHLHKLKKSPTAFFCIFWNHSLHCPWPFNAILDLQIHGDPANLLKVSVLEVARLCTGFQVLCAKILNVAHHLHQTIRDDHSFPHGCA